MTTYKFGQHLKTSIDQRESIQVRNRIRKGRKVASIHCDGTRLNPKKISRLGLSLLVSVTACGSKIWVPNEWIKRRLKALEINYLRRKAGKFRNVNLKRTPEERWPKKAFEREAPGKNKRRRARSSGGIWKRLVQETRRYTTQNIIHNYAFLRTTFL